MANKFEKQFLSEELSDVRFVVGKSDESKVVFPAHRVVLCTASSEFSTLFLETFPVPSEITITDVSAEAFKAVLQYFYTDTIGLTKETAFEVLYLARKYLLEKLTADTLQFLFAIDNASLAYEFLRHRDLFDVDFADQFWDIVDNFAEEILRSDEFLSLDKESVRVIVQRGQLSVNERLVYERLVAWAEEERKRKDLGDTPIRSVLGNLFRLIRFSAMTAQYFTGGPAKDGILTPAEILEIYQNIRGEKNSIAVYQLGFVPWCRTPEPAPEKRTTKKSRRKTLDPSKLGGLRLTSHEI